MARDGECARPRSRHARNHPESRQDRASVWLGRTLGPIPLLSARYLMTLGKALDALALPFLLSKLADMPPSSPPILMKLKQDNVCDHLKARQIYTALVLKIITQIHSERLKDTGEIDLGASSITAPDSHGEVGPWVIDVAPHSFPKEGLGIWRLPATLLS